MNIREEDINLHSDSELLDLRNSSSCFVVVQKSFRSFSCLNFARSSCGFKNIFFFFDFFVFFPIFCSLWTTCWLSSSISVLSWLVETDLLKKGRKNSRLQSIVLPVLGFDLPLDCVEQQVVHTALKCRWIYTDLHRPIIFDISKPVFLIEKYFPDL